MTGPQAEREGQEPTGRLRFDFTCTADRKPEEVYELLREIGRGVRLRPTPVVLKVWGQTPGDYAYAYEVAGVCAYAQASRIVRALAEDEVWTTVTFEGRVSRGERGIGLSGIFVGYQVSITPELKASYQT